ncbi:MAG: DNA polymerase III subunit delta [Pseudomonadota bacterium]
MKLSGAKALQFCRKPPAGAKVILLFGSDTGVVADAANTLASAWLGDDADPLNVTRLQEDEVKKDPAMLFDALVARSLLGGATLLRLRLSGDSAAKPMVDAIESIDTGDVSSEAYWLIEAGDLPPKSKIRKAFEKSKQAHALHLFADDEDAVADLARRALSDIAADIEPEALALFASELPGDRHMAKSEIEKLALYSLDLGRPVAAADVAAIAATDQPKGSDAAADAALAGDYQSADAAITRFLEAGGSPVSALRTLHFRMLRISDAQAGAKYLRPPVFDRDRPAFDRVLTNWPPTRIARALTLLYSAETTCKQGGAPSEAALRIVIDRLARRRV